MVSLGFELDSQITLKGESSCWIISRNNETSNEYSAIIHIKKEDRCQKMFITLGTFFEDNLVYKHFLKQQLIDSSSNIGF